MSSKLKTGRCALFTVLKDIGVRPGELSALMWSLLYVFALFLSYYILRPIRDDLGIAGGVDNLPWLFTGTLLAMLALNPLFAFAVKKWSRKKFIAYAYRFFMVNLVAFILLLSFAGTQQTVWVGRAFFIWVSVFNLFVVSIFWSFIVDVFTAEQGKRLFGILASGATIGGIAGSALTSGFVATLGQNWLLLGSVLLLEIAVFASGKLSLVSASLYHTAQGTDAGSSVGGGLFTGMTHTFKSPYLMGIAAFILLYSVTSTLLYFNQAAIVEENFRDSTSRTAFFANIDLWVNVITLIFQLLLTGRLVKWLGVAATLCILPFVSLLGFAALASFPVVAVFVAMQVARRVSNFALARPAREILFTTLPREDRYKAKNFIDTVIYRGGDQIASWAYAGLTALGLTLSTISVITIPLSGAWLLLSFWLGRRQKAAALSEIDQPPSEYNAYKKTA